MHLTVRKLEKQPEETSHCEDSWKKRFWTFSQWEIAFFPFWGFLCVRKGLFPGFEEFSRRDDSTELFGRFLTVRNFCQLLLKLSHGEKAFRRILKIWTRFFLLNMNLKNNLIMKQIPKINYLIQARRWHRTICGQLHPSPGGVFSGCRWQSEYVSHRHGVRRLPQNHR